MFLEAFGLFKRRWAIAAFERSFVGVGEHVVFQVVAFHDFGADAACRRVLGVDRFIVSYHQFRHQCGHG